MPIDLLTTVREIDAMELMDAPSGINTPTGLALWLQTQPEAATDRILHVLPSETSKWERLPLETFQRIAHVELPSTNSQHWDAFIETITVKRLHNRRLSAPEWTRKTNLEESWNPYAEANPRTAPIQDFWSMIYTTLEFIEKAIIHPQQDLANLWA